MRSGFGYWLAGFADGEGCFTIDRQHSRTKNAFSCRFAIGLRRDDLDTLELIREQLGGIGSITFAHQRHTPKAMPQARYYVCDREGAGVIRDTFRRFPLRSKKRHDFAIWAEAVDLWLAAPARTVRGDEYGAAMRRLRTRLVVTRRYWDPEQSARLLDAYLEAVAS